jgi:hypothetical protein
VHSKDARQYNKARPAKVLSSWNRTDAGFPRFSSAFSALMLLATLRATLPDQSTTDAVDKRESFRIASLVGKTAQQKKTPRIQGFVLGTALNPKSSMNCRNTT